MKSTTKNNPELMTVVCNIQAIKSKINPNYDSVSDFSKLDKLTGEELYEIQDSLIPEYNKAIQTF